MKEQIIRELDSENYALRTYSIQLEVSVNKFNVQYNLLREENQALRDELKAFKQTRDMSLIESKASDLFNHLHIFLLGKMNYFSD